VGLPFTGTVGILVASVRDGALTIARGEELLLQMRNDGFYSPVARLADLLA
jgi:predicted nucleic acid-binding protein